jgi:asparagine synthase (glutamine-hydrolysing)
MSAIFGLVHFHGGPVARADLERMDAALSRFGTDGGGLSVTKSVGMGQRLMAFTNEDRFERQPLTSADGTLVLVSDARIDNRDELADALYACSAGPATQDDTPDSALILRAYEAWGSECVGRLAGVFAFAVWDRRTRTLFAARSPIVAPTLLYHTTGRTFAFATAPGGLHALPCITRALNEERLADMLVQMDGSPPASTLYRHISRLPTGFRLMAGRDGVRTRCCWQPDLSREIRFSRDEEYPDAFNDLFERVVGAHLRSTTRVAVQMSGGLDSSAVAATAARLLARRGERLTAFTEVPGPGFSGPVPPGAYADETPFVEAIAAMHGNLDLNLMRTDGQLFLDELDILFPHLEAPLRNTSNRVWIESILREAARRDMKVLLDGLQGNLTMSWYGSGMLPGLIRSGKWGEAYRQVRTTRSPWRALVVQGVLPLLPAPLWSAVERLRHPAARTEAPWLTNSAINPGFAKAQRVPERARERDFATRCRPGADSRMNRYRALAGQDFGAYISAYRAMYGVDMRTPTADVRLAEFCLALPEDQYRRNGESRSLIRRAMAAHLPEMVLANRLRGMQAADWFERLTGQRDRIAQVLGRMEQGDLARRILDLGRIRLLFERMPVAASNQDDFFRDYQWVFQQGLMVGSFLCWFEDGGR